MEALTLLDKVKSKEISRSFAIFTLKDLKRRDAVHTTTYIKVLFDLDNFKRAHFYTEVRQ